MFKDAKDYDTNLRYLKWSDQRKAKQSEIGKRVMACPEQRKIKSRLFKKSIEDLDAKGKEWRQRGSKNRKPVSTPYGEYPSALTAAKLLGPKLGLKPCTIQSYIIRTTEKYKDWYYIEEVA